MTTTIETPIELPETLFDQSTALAKQLNITQEQLFKIAIEQYINNHNISSPAETNLIVNQGDVYRVKLDADSIPHPYVIIQDNLLNHSRIDTVVACALTSNIKRASSQGNILLEADEGNLPKQSVVEVSKITTIEKIKLGAYIGSLTNQRVKQILAGIQFLQTSYFNR